VHWLPDEGRAASARPSLRSSPGRGEHACRELPWVRDGECEPGPDFLRLQRILAALLCRRGIDPVNATTLALGWRPRSISVRGNEADLTHVLAKQQGDHEPEVDQSGQRSASNYHSKVGWMPCECPEAQAENMGHLWVRCHAEAGCTSIWYRPAHSPKPRREANPTGDPEALDKLDALAQGSRTFTRTSRRHLRPSRAGSMQSRGRTHNLRHARAMDVSPELLADCRSGTRRS
jgi:hypothetical protein